MDVAHRFGYWIGAASFAIGLVWNALRIAGMLPPDLNNAPLSISVLVFGSLLIGWVKVNSARRAEHGTSQSYKDTYLAWLSDDATPDFSPTPPRSPDMRDQPDPRRGFTPLEPHVNYPLHLGRTRFDIRFPQCRTQSWIGGQPELPTM